MTVLTLVRYLLGGREAILTIAASRHALWVGLLFVLSAGFAREYDGEDLLHEPWHVVVPVGASLASSALLFLLAYGVAVARGESAAASLPRYLSFLGLFWLTAPLAWVYAVPYERFLSPADALYANLTSLAVVSAWRVALMVRVLMVLMNYRFVAALCLVLLFADVVALTLISFLPFPLIDVMGGIRLSERERIMRDVACAVVQLGVCSFPFWALGALARMFDSQPKWCDEEPRGARPSIPLAAVAVGSVLIWAAVLPSTQPPQVRRWHVEQAFKQEDVEAALREMSRHEPTDYPPGWEPPPTRANVFGSRAGDPRLMGVLELLGEIETADWVREVYLDKAARMLGGWAIDEKDVERIARVLRRIPGGTAVIDRMDDEQLAEALREALAKPDGK